MSAAPRCRLSCVDRQRPPDAVLRVAADGRPDAFAEAEWLLAAGRDVVVALHGQGGVATVGALARLALAARRSGARLAVQADDGALPRLIGLTGLDAVLLPHLATGDAEPWSGQAQR